MLNALLSHDDKTAVFNLPHNQLGVENYLLAVGASKKYADLHLSEDEDDPEQVQIKLIAETAIDNHLQLLFSQGARLSAVNTVCDLFYHLPIEQQSELINGIADGQITGEKDLLDAVKRINTATPHDLPAILFSRVWLCTDGGQDSEFWMSGDPQEYDDIEDTEGLIDFQEFLDGLPGSESRTITAEITVFCEGDGALQPASPEDMVRIENAVDEVDIDAISGWNKIGQHAFAFDYDLDELLNQGMPGIT